MLGHTDAGFTMNTYMHVTDFMQENVANTMGNLLFEMWQIHKWSRDGLERKIKLTNKISLREKERDFLLHIEF